MCIKLGWASHGACEDSGRLMWRIGLAITHRVNASWLADRNRKIEKMVMTLRGGEVPAGVSGDRRQGVGWQGHARVHSTHCVIIVYPRTVTRTSHWGVR